MKSQPLRVVLLSLLAVCFSAEAQQAPAVRMYLFDNGQINGLDPALFNFTAEEVKETDFVVTSELIVHPNCTLLWECRHLAKIQKILEETGAKIWIGHDKTTHASLKFAPAYYE